MSDNLTKKFDGSNGSKDELVQLVQTAVRAELTDVRTELTDLRAGLTDLRNTVNTRLYDTRPMWEKLSVDVQQLKNDVGELRTDVGELKTDVVELKTDVGELKADVGQLKNDVVELKAGQEGLRQEVREVRTCLRDVGRRMSIFNDTLTGIQADYRDMYDRVREIEGHRN